MTRNPLREDIPQVDIYYDPSLTLAKIISVVRQKQAQLPNLGIVIVDYLNQVKRSLASGRQYEWTEQIEVSKTLKSMAQQYETMVFSPYQTDATGEARFAKGILDAADAAPCDAAGINSAVCADCAGRGVDCRAVSSADANSRNDADLRTENSRDFHRARGDGTVYVHHTQRF